MSAVGRAEIRAAVVDSLGAWYGLAAGEIDDDRPLAELGLTSRDAVVLTARLGDLAGTRLPATLLWEAPTIGALVEWVERGEPEHGGAPPDTGRTGVPSGGEEGAAQAAGDDVPGGGEGAARVAVIGIGCRLPGDVTSPAAFWQLLSEGRDAVGTVGDDRWPPFVREGTSLPGDLSRHGGFLGDGRLDGVAGFDAEFFGIGADEATAMDPQQRMLLEVVREAVDHAALSVPSLAGSRTGVFVGISGNEYAHLTTAEPESIGAWTSPGAALSIAANRLSYLLDLRGPSMAVDTACSSSLVAVHHAVRSLGAGESDMALAAGVNLLLAPSVTLGFQRAGALAADGRCKAFDASADGMVRGEGCGVVVLKRLADAERDGDRVLAVIESTAVNSDGRSNGLTAPSAQAQRTLLEQSHGAGGAAVDYVEAHGTGTALGDPIEAAALSAALGAGRGRAVDQPLLIGSVKTNIGHLEAAAGIAGLIKTVLALHHDEIPPQLHFTAPSPHADLDALGLRVVTGPEPWPRYSGTARAGVSAFGFGGTNAHVVLCEHRVPRAPRRADSAPAIALLDGVTEDRVRAYAGELAAWLADPRSRSVRPADLARTLAGRTGRGRHRAAVVARGREELTTALGRLAGREPDGRVVVGAPAAGDGPGAVWVFSGYGSQWAGMGRELLSAEPEFAAAVDRVEPLLRDLAGVSLRHCMAAGADLTSPAVVMPALYGMQVALAELWKSYGFEPAAVIGHSMGEIAAAVASGALDAATGARVVAIRSRLLAGLTGGAMAVVDRPGEGIEALAADFPTLQVAVHASPAQSVVTGSADDVRGLIDHVTGQGGFARSLRVTGAGHSSHVDPLLAEFARELGAVPHAAPGCRRYSTVLADPRDPAPCDADYWVANLRRPVRFSQAVRAAADDGHRVFVEVAPHPTQLHPLTETLRDAGVDGPLILPTLRRDTDDALTFRTSLASLLVQGSDAPAARRRLHPGARVADVPPPRWRHRRFWAGETPGPRETPRHATAPAPAARVLSTLDRLRGCVADVMGYSPDRIDADTPLTDLGLDSLTAARVRTAVEREFGVAVEPGVLLRQATLRGVAELLPDSGGAWRTRGASREARDAHGPRDGGDSRDAHAFRHTRDAHDSRHTRHARDPQAPRDSVGPLRVLADAAGGVPLFLAHAAGGSSAVYARLAERLGGARSVYGFDRMATPEDLGPRAEHFARRIRAVSPEGPWIVGGWSYGGLLAQEAARLLARHGTVSALVLLDSVLPLPAPPGLTPVQEARRRYADFAAYIARTYRTQLPLPFEELARLDDAEQIALVMKLLEQAVDLPRGVLDHQRTSALDLRSGERHRPGPYAGRTLLYRATEPAPHTVRDVRYERDDESLGWDAHCTDLTVTPLPGHHLSLLDPPVVEVLAGLLARDLPDS
ncbi:polyketide synthase [Streptomyces longisporoflavus]|uniref:type I polyketide synthase n=1 Tax=Streptomyces longisporoflavus TaxID=28044 RepID=UPI00167E40A3|nr:type I polyketide synthase [Streptomyces longisporoflavus]GGV41994.1 polyketide synthase [Streptomyces longisporoflavus]